jgi:hypothetical protein
MPAINHVHTYRRINKDLWKCNDPYCTHTCRRELVQGKASICNKCDKEIVMTPSAMQRRSPLCLECSNTAEARSYKKAKALVESLRTLTEPPAPEPKSAEKPTDPDLRDWLSDNN